MDGGGDLKRVPQAWRKVENLLAVRLDSMGDVLMTTPAIAAFKETLGCRITLLTSPAGAAVGKHVSEVDEILVYDAPWMKAAAARNSGEFDRAMIDRLRAESFDAAVIFTVYSQNPLPAALMAFLADIPLRLAHCRENPYLLLTDWVNEPEPERFVRHEVQRQLDLAAAVGCRTINPRLRFDVPAADRQAILELLDAFGVDRPFVVIHPGASSASRRYPPEHFAEVVRLMADEGYPVLLTGSAEESTLVESINRDSGYRAKAFSRQLPLGQLAALLAASSLLIANNTGPVHLAAAIGTPVVDLYALTNPQHTPWMVPNITLAYDVPCRWCYKSVCPEGHHHCLRNIEPAWVLHAAKTLLAGEPPEQITRTLTEGLLYDRFPGSEAVSA